MLAKAFIEKKRPTKWEFTLTSKVKKRLKVGDCNAPAIPIIKVVIRKAKKTMLCFWRKDEALDINFLYHFILYNYKHKKARDTVEERNKKWLFLDLFRHLSCTQNF